MAGGQERILKERIRSVRATKKITRAMELIAASRIVRAQARVAAAVPYSEQITEVVKALAAGGEQWFNQRPDDRASLAKRLNELRQGCSVVIASDHPPLSPHQQKELKDRCSKWAAQFDAALVRLENDEDPVAVRTDVDAVVTKLVAYLNSQRQA